MSIEFPSKLSKEILDKFFTEKEIKKAFDKKANEEENLEYEISDIIYYGEVLSQSRPRFRVVGNWGHAYDDPKVSKFKKGFKEFVVEEIFNSVTNHVAYFPAEGEIKMNIKVFRAIPKTWSKYKKILAESGLIRPEGKPDFDNLAKSICDSLNGVIYKDDGQIVSCHVDKYFSMTPRAELSFFFKIKGNC